MKRSLFSPLGIIGWEPIQPVLIAALAAQLPILLLGNHGTCKTDGTETIVHALCGNDGKFVKYDTMSASMDDIVGFPSPKSLMDNEISFIPTKISIWGAKGVNLDELNRASPLTASKFLEMSRKGEVHGQKTGLEFIFASCNPVRAYRTAYMDLAAASRWVIVHNPGWADLSEVDKRRVLDAHVKSKPSETEATDLRNAVEAARSFVQNPEAAVDAIIKEMVHKILDKLNAYSTAIPSKGGAAQTQQNAQTRAFRFKTEARQGIAMVRLLRAYHGYRLYMEEVADTKDMLTLILSCIPEVHELCETSCDPSTASSLIQPILNETKFPDSLPTLHTLRDLIQHRGTKDRLAWAATAKKLLAPPVSSSKEDVTAFARELISMLRASQIAVEPFNDLFGLVVKSGHIDMADHLLDCPLGWQREGLRAIIEDMKQQAA